MSPFTLITDLVAILIHTVEMMPQRLKHSFGKAKSSSHQPKAAVDLDLLHFVADAFTAVTLTAAAVADADVGVRRQQSTVSRALPKWLACSTLAPLTSLSAEQAGGGRTRETKRSFVRHASCMDQVAGCWRSCLCRRVAFCVPPILVQHQHHHLYTDPALTTSHQSV